MSLGGSAGAPSLSVVIPIYNEEAILRETVTSVVGALSQMTEIRLCQLILADNGSTDRTLLIAYQLAADHSAVVVLSSKVPNYGAAMRAGILSATGDWIVNFDADYYDYEFVRLALGLGADIVIAAKNIVGSADTRAVARRMGSMLFGWLVRHLLDIRTTETHGIKLYRRAAIEPLLPLVVSTKDLFDTELVARAEHSGLRIAELPIATNEMRHSRSGILRRVPRTIWGLFRLRYRLRSSAQIRVLTDN